MDELISIIVPIYNTEKYLEECIESIINQSYINIEIILVDDCSTDSCGFICDRYLSKDVRIKVIHNQLNEGLSVARNIGIENAKGVYVAFVDSDDYVNSEYIKDLYGSCVAASSAVAQCNFTVVDEDSSFYTLKNEAENDEYAWTEIKQSRSETKTYSEAKGQEVFNEMYIYSGRDMIKNIYNELCLPTTLTWTKLYKKSLFSPGCEYNFSKSGNGIKFPEGRIHEDEAVSYRIFYEVDRVAFIDKPLYYYRNVPGSISRKKYSYKRMDNLISIDERLQFFIYNNDRGLYELTLRRYFYELLLAKKNCFRHIPDSEQVQKNLKKKAKSILKEILKVYKFEDKTEFNTFLIKLKCIKLYFFG